MFVGRMRHEFSKLTFLAFAYCLTLNMKKKHVYKFEICNELFAEAVES